VTAGALAAAGAALVAVGVVWLAMSARGRRRRWRENALDVERASFHCNGDERSKRVQP
jgi:cell division septation protein DedD